MSNEVGMFGGGKVGLAKSKADLSRALKKSADDSASQGALPENNFYVNFSGKNGKLTRTVSEDGKYVKKDLDVDLSYLASPQHFTHGWICWKGKKPVGRYKASIFEPHPELVNPEEHGPFDTNRGEGWQKSTGMMFRCLNEGWTGHFDVSSASGTSEMGRLKDAMATQIENDLPYWPVFNIGVEEFEAQGFTNYKPVFEVAGWLTDAAVEEAAKAEDEDELFEIINSNLWTEGDPVPGDGEENIPVEEPEVEEPEVEEVPARKSVRRPRVGS